MLDNTNNWKDKMQVLKNHASPIDLPLEWDALENRMEKRKRRKFVFWMWPVILGIGIISGYFLASDNNQIQSPTQKAISKPTVAIVQQNTASFEADKLMLNEDFKIQSTPTSLVNRHKKSTTHEESIVMMGDSGSTVVSLKKQNFNNKINISNNTLPFKIEQRSSQDINDMKIMPLIDSSLNSDPLILNQTVIISHTDFTETPLLITNPAQIEQPTILPKLYPSIIGNHQKRHLFFFDVRSMAGRSLYGYKGFDQENLSLVNQRKINERPLEHLGGRLSVGKSFKLQWYASVGLSYSRLNEKWHGSRYDTSDIVLQNQVLESYTNHLGQKVENIGDKRARQVSEVTQTRINTVEQVATTLALGRYFYIYKIRLALEANISIPIHSRFSGQAWDNYEQMTGLETIYQSFNTLQYGMHTSYIYPVSGNLAIYGGYDYNFSRLKSDLGYFRTQHLHSISFGVKYFINK